MSRMGRRDGGRDLAHPKILELRPYDRTPDVILCRSIHAFSSVSSAVVDRGSEGAGGGQFDLHLSLRIVSTL